MSGFDFLLLTFLVLSSGSGLTTDTEDEPGTAPSQSATADTQEDAGARDQAEFDGYSRVAELMVEKLLRSVRKVSSYRDEAVLKTVTGLPFGRGEQAVSFAYVRPRRFGIKTDNHDIHGDGKKLTVYAKRLRRYTVEPIDKDKDVARQIARYLESRGMRFRVGELFLSRDPRKYFAKHFRDLDLAGRETLEEERCYVLSGSAKASAMGMSEADVPATLWLRESDSLIRRIELDLLDAIKERSEEGGGMFMRFREYKVIYDVRDLQVNEPVAEEIIAFKPPSGAKKVDRFFATVGRPGETATQFERSGKRAPDFELETTDGRWMTRESLEGDVVVLDFLSPWASRWRGRDLGRYEQLDEIQRDYADRTVTILCVWPQASADRLMDQLRGAGLNLTVVLDENRAVTGEYFEDGPASGIVLLDPKGIIQGCYRGGLGDETARALRGDLDKLLAGESLPGGKEMNDEQIAEAREQRATDFSTRDSAGPVHEEHLKQAWSVHASASQSFGFGRGASAARRDLWIRDKSVVRLISPEGKTVVELPIANPTFSRFGQDAFVAGRLGARWSVVYMAPIPGEEEFMGFRRPKGAKLTASDESGEVLWELELEATGRQLPRHLALADIDGRRGDELLFVHEGSIWIVDGRGEVMVRKPCTGSPQWLFVDDRDRDGRPEVYLRTQHKLERLDYRPG